MPELPEVETVRQGLEATVVGRTVTEVRGTGRRALRRQGHASFVSRLQARTVVATRRKGKYLLLDLDDDGVLVVHLRMSGQLIYASPNDELVAHTHLVLALDNGHELRFVDPRTFGELFVCAPSDLEGPSELGSFFSRLGVDPLTDGCSAESLRHLLARRRTSLKAFFLDQSNIAGIGNLYADEIGFAARLLPARRTDEISFPETERLALAITTVVHAAVEAGGSSLRDERYRDVFGEVGNYQHQHMVYGREDEACRVCGTPIVRRKIAGRSAFFCPTCQV